MEDLSGNDGDTVATESGDDDMKDVNYGDGRVKEIDGGKGGHDALLSTDRAGLVVNRMTVVFPLAA